jgi:hypothetical protein
MLELDGNWVFAWGVDDSNRSVGGTACLLALGLLEFVCPYDSCLVTPKSFSAGRRCFNTLAIKPMTNP